MDPTVAGDDGRRVEVERIAGEARDAPARLLEEEAARRHVPRPERERPEAVEAPGGEPGEVEHGPSPCAARPGTDSANAAYSRRLLSGFCRMSGQAMTMPLSDRLEPVALYLRYQIGISYRKTTQLLQELFGLKFVAASAVGFDRKASRRGEPLHEDLREKIRTCDVVHADETSWRNDGVGHYAWFAGNEKLAFFHIDRHRSAHVAKAIFGEHFEGTLVRDRYAAYNGIGSQWQSCLSHIITKTKEIKREHELLPPAERETLTDRFCDQVVAFFKEACLTGARLKSEELPWKATESIQNRMVKQLCKLQKATWL